MLTLQVGGAEIVAACIVYVGQLRNPWNKSVVVCGLLPLSPCRLKT